MRLFGSSCNSSDGYGKQTMSGLIKDGISALSRYYLNNFQDGVQQDVIDRICGNYTIIGNSPSSFQQNKSESRIVLCSTWKDDGTTVFSFSGCCEKQVDELSDKLLLQEKGISDPSSTKSPFKGQLCQEILDLGVRKMYPKP